MDILEMLLLLSLISTIYNCFISNSDYNEEYAVFSGIVFIILLLICFMIAFHEEEKRDKAAYLKKIEELHGKDAAELADYEYKLKKHNRQYIPVYIPIRY